jgi:Glutaminase
MKSTEANYANYVWQRYAAFVVALLAIALSPAYAQRLIPHTPETSNPYWTATSYDQGDPLAKIDVLTEQQAADLFKKLKNTKGIPFDYPDDGCFARAHKMYQIISDSNYNSQKIWNYGIPYGTGALTVITAKNPNGFVNWWYHVAPVVKVRINNRIQYRVMDPSLFDRPATVAEWVNEQDNLDKKGFSRSLWELTKPDFYTHNYKDGSTLDAGLIKTKLALAKYNDLLERRKQGKAPSLRLSVDVTTGQVVVGLVRSFDPVSGSLQLVGSNDTYLLPTNDSLYSSWVDLITTSQTTDGYLYLTLDSTLYGVQDLLPATIVTVNSLAQGSGRSPLTVIMATLEALYYLDPTGPQYPGFLALLQQSAQSQTPVLVTADENEAILDVRAVPAGN